MNRAGGATTLVVGAGGLLGRAVTRELDRRGTSSVRARVRWGVRADAVEDLGRAVDELLRTAGDGPWAVVWAAGAGVTASTADALGAELDVIRDVVSRLRALPTDVAARGALLFASSAGGLYAGSDDPPFTEETAPRPLAEYGRAKLDAEDAFRTLGGAGTRVVLARIANIYGPGQNLAKPQGLISQLCLAHHTARPIGIYVPLDTLRDYLFVDDCAAMVLDTLDRAATLPPGSDPVVKILASQQSVSIATLLGEMRRIYKRRPQAVLAASPFTSRQALDLRFRSRVWPELDHRAFVPLPVGIAATGADIGLALRSRTRG
ncbi:NAD-dependent epimerase/dehydratase family protein [Cellulosimicrobium sp. CpK407]|uniref:NAD-dependent epimerase/dehydratase family protein n=1 Tax=Cellulosimicrobium sp. CpK407 TaxID=3229847 RepID=UPI003F2A54CD